MTSPSSRAESSSTTALPSGRARLRTSRSSVPFAGWSAAADHPVEPLLLRLPSGEQLTSVRSAHRRDVIPVGLLVAGQGEREALRRGAHPDDEVLEAAGCAEEEHAAAFRADDVAMRDVARAPAEVAGPASTTSSPTYRVTRPSRTKKPSSSRSWTCSGASAFGGSVTSTIVSWPPVSAAPALITARALNHQRALAVSVVVVSLMAVYLGSTWARYGARRSRSASGRLCGERR